MNICRICERKFESNIGFSLHLRKHEMNFLDYHIKYERFKIPKCLYCKKNSKYAKGLFFRQTCGKQPCILQYRKRSEETKKKLSKARIKYLNENRDSIVWTWACPTIENKPEKEFRKIIQEYNINETIHQYYIPKESDRFFEIDFAILNKKIGFEINGNQHYDSNGKLKKYYEDREKYLQSLGWTIIQIHYSVCFDRIKIEEIIASALRKDVKSAHLISNKIINDRIKRKKKRELEKKEYRTKVQKNKKRRLTQFAQEKKIIQETIEKYGRKLGIIKKIAGELNVTHTTARKKIQKFNLRDW